jgi:hypothetical protein
LPGWMPPSCPSSPRNGAISFLPGPENEGNLVTGIKTIPRGPLGAAPENQSMSWRIKRLIKIRPQGFLSCPEKICSCGLILSRLAITGRCLPGIVKKLHSIEVSGF